MHSNWYKKQKARREAPQYLLWMVTAPVLGVTAIAIARVALAHSGEFLSNDQTSFMAASLAMIAVGAFVFAGYCAVKIAQLAHESKLNVIALLRQERD